MTMITLMLILAGCSMPSTTVRTVDSRPGISIAGAPDDAILLVDGLESGRASSYNGKPNLLLIQPGTHRIVVKQGSTILYDQQIFVDSENKTINIR